jgi:hypothetical protein
MSLWPAVLEIQEIQEILEEMVAADRPATQATTQEQEAKVAVVAEAVVVDHNLTLVFAQGILGQDHYHSTQVRGIMEVRANQDMQYKALVVVLVVLVATEADIMAVGVVTDNQDNPALTDKTGLALVQETLDMVETQETQAVQVVHPVFTYIPPQQEMVAQEDQEDPPVILEIQEYMVMEMPEETLEGD